MPTITEVEDFPVNTPAATIEAERTERLTRPGAISSKAEKKSNKWELTTVYSDTDT